MKTKKLLKKVKGLLNGEERKKKKEVAALVKLVRKLKAKEKEIEKKMDSADGAGERNKLAKRIAMVRLQLEKGKGIIKASANYEKAGKQKEAKEPEKAAKAPKPKQEKKEKKKEEKEEKGEKEEGGEEEES